MRIFKALKISLGLVLLATVLAIFWLWTPDTGYDDMLTKYHPTEPRFAELRDGTRIHYSDKGNRAGRALLLIHGTSDSLLTWNKLEAELIDEFRLISLDLPGHGFSSAPETPSFNHFIDVSVSLLDQLGVEQAIWVGNSLGGGIAWRAALLQPERVSALVLLDPSGAPSTTPPKSNLGFRLLSNPIGRFIGRHVTPRALIENSLRDTVADPQHASAAMIDRYWELLRLPGNRAALARLASLRRSGKSWDRIGDVTAPTLIVWGAEDQITPTENAGKFAAAIPNSSLQIYDNVGHLPMVEAPRRLASDIRAFARSLPQ